MCTNNVANSKIDCGSHFMNGFDTKSTSTVIEGGLPSEKITKAKVSSPTEGNIQGSTYLSLLDVSNISFTFVHGNNSIVYINMYMA